MQYRCDVREGEWRGYQTKDKREEGGNMYIYIEREREKFF
jgi:hypothetical protein